MSLEIAKFHLPITAALFGLIWTIQLVHYPAFAFVAENRWSDFHSMHTKKITFIVFPLMLAELGIACLTLFHSPPPVMLLICLIPIIQWLLTASIFIPLHNQLRESNTRSLVQKLVRLNWLRTLFWSAELLALVMLAD